MMRKYTRKRPDFQQLEDVLELCRLCLQKPSEPIPIYESDDLFSSLALRIMVCVGLEISQEKDLPNNICKECHRQLEKYHAFRKKCEYSYQRLKSHVLAVKQQKLNDDAIKKQEPLEGENWDNKEALALPLNKDRTTHSNDESKARRHNKELTSSKRRVSEDYERQVLVLKAETEQTKNLIDEKLETDMNGTENCVGHPASNGEDCTSDEKESGDLAVFLSSTLTALGILTTKEDGTVALLSNSLSSVEVESGDGTEIIMELVAEDDGGEVENTILGTTINESAQKAPTVLTNSVENAPINDQADSMPTNLNCNVWNNVDSNIQPAVTQVRVPLNDDDRTNKTSLVKPQIEPQKISVCGKRLVPCAQCGRGFSSRATMARHVAAVHAKKRPHVCALCGRRFAQKEVWARHLLVHQEKRPFQCDKCEKSFTQRGALASHTRLHAPPASRWLTLHQCPRCPKLFLHHSGLSRHLRVHSGRTWQCDGCGRSFSDGSALRRHRRVCTHTPTGNHTHALKPTPDRPIAPTSLHKQFISTRSQKTNGDG